MPLARIHPLYLHFDDERLEADLRNSQLYSSRLVVIFFGLFAMLFIELSGYGGTILQFVCAAALLMFAYISEESICNMFVRMQTGVTMHTFYCYFWSMSWVVNVAVWWYMIAQGKMQRLQPDEFAKVGACCGLWIIVLVSQHILHMSFAHRSIVLGLALSIVLSGAVWEALMLSVVVGEVCGYALEHKMRADFLWRVEVLERLRCEKERAVYELQIAQAEVARSRSGSNRGPASVEGDQSIAETTMSFGTNSELADFLPHKQSEEEEARLASSFLPLSRDGMTPPNEMGVTKVAESLRQRHVQLLSEERCMALWRTLDASGIVLTKDE